MRRLAGIAVVAGAALLSLPLLTPRGASAAGFLTVSPAIRAQGMGSIGTADSADPANAFFNPAIIASANGAFLSAAYTSFSYDYGLDSQTDTYIYSIGLGAGFSRDIGDNLTGSFGFGLGYDGLRSQQSSLYSTPYDDDETYAALTLGGGLLIGEAFYAGVGAALKPWRESVGLPPGRETSKTAYDIGAIARMRVVETDRTSLTCGLGASALNLGGSIGPGRVLPKTYRYGAELHFEEGKSEYCSEHFCVEVPLIAASLAYDYIDARFDSLTGYGKGWGLGAEVAFFRIIFLRAGYDRFGEGQDYPSFGVGIGFGYQAFRVRIDFADVGSVEGSDYTDKYGFFVNFNY
jgi:hypothetical protein